MGSLRHTARTRFSNESLHLIAISLRSLASGQLYRNGGMEIDSCDLAELYTTFTPMDCLVRHP